MDLGGLVGREGETVPEDWFADAEGHCELCFLFLVMAVVLFVVVCFVMMEFV